MFKWIFPSNDKISQWEFSKVAVLKCSTKEPWAALLAEHLVLNLLSAKIRRKEQK